MNSKENEVEPQAVETTLHEASSGDGEALSRREMLKTVGLTAGALAVGAATASSVLAQREGGMRRAPINVGPVNAELKANIDKMSEAQLKELAVRSLPLPLNTPITRMRVDEKLVAKLTPAAQKLSKQDLIELNNWDTGGPLSPKLQDLSIRDIRSIQDVFIADIRKTGMVGGPGNLAIDISCCCCTPCCCASAEMNPVRPLL